MPPMQRYVSDELHHFVGGKLDGKPEEAYAILTTILQDKRLLRGTHGETPGLTFDINWGGSLLDENFVVPAATCFCDIPADDLHIHVQNYGPFGLSFKKQDLVEWGARPVIYVPLYDRDEQSIYGRGLLRDIEEIYKGHQRLVVDQIPKDSMPESRVVGAAPSSSGHASELLQDLVTKHLLAFIKPFNTELPDGHSEQYYLEREWRLVADFPFELNQVRRVFLPEAYAGRLRKDVPAYCGQVTFTE